MALYKYHYIELDTKRSPRISLQNIVAGETGNLITVSLTNDEETVNLAEKSGGEFIYRVALRVDSDLGTRRQDSAAPNSGITFVESGTDAGKVQILLSCDTYTAGKNRCTLEIYSTRTTENDTLVVSAEVPFTAKGKDHENTGVAMPAMVYLEQLAKSYARGGTGVRDGENIDNAKYYKNLAEQAVQGGIIDPTFSAWLTAHMLEFLAEVGDTADDWLAEHITNPSNPPLDTSLSLSNAAAPANLVGDLKSTLTGTIFRYDNEYKSYIIGGLNGNTGAANNLKNHLRCTYIKLNIGDKIFNSDTVHYNVHVYKYDATSYAYDGRVLWESEEYIIDDSANYRLMVNKKDGTDFTTTEAENCSEIVYFSHKISILDEKADLTDLEKKVNAPSPDKFGESGDYLVSDGNGNTHWVHPGEPSPEIIQAAIAAWMEEHPESVSGFVNPIAFGAIGNGVADDTVAIQDAINYAVTNGIPVVDGIGKTYVVSGAVHGPESEVKDSYLNYGLYLHGNLLFRNFNFKLKDDTDTQLTSVLNVYNATSDKIVIENVTIDGNRTNQNSVPTGKGQDGGFHGIRVGFVKDCGIVEINNCFIHDCYTDGIVTRPVNYARMKIANCIITGNGRNGITDNAIDSIVERCRITGNGTRTAPRSGYHIEPDNSINFGTKKVKNCVIKNNTSGDFRIYFNTKTYNIDLLEIDSCDIGSVSWGNHGTTDDCIHKNIRVVNSIIDSIGYGNGNDVSGLNRFEVFEIVNTRIISNIGISGGVDYQSGAIMIESVALDGYASLSDTEKVIFSNNMIAYSGNRVAVDFGNCENVVCIGNISNVAENSTFDTSSVTTAQKANNIYSA